MLFRLLCVVTNLLNIASVIVVIEKTRNVAVGTFSFSSLVLVSVFSIW